MLELSPITDRSLFGNDSPLRLGISPVACDESPSFLAEDPESVAFTLSASPPHPGQNLRDSHAAEDAELSRATMWSLDDFELGQRVGSGSFGYVQLVRERSSRCLAVLKVMKKRRMERMRVQRHVVREVDIQAHLRHPNILRLLGFFWDHCNVYMIIEHAAGGDLHQHMQKQPGKHLEEDDAAPLFAQALSAVAYCHSMHVIHRDLKPQNLLLEERSTDTTLKLGDFGWAVHTYPNEKRWTVCGTPDYLPPEMVNGKGHSFGVDVWGLGVVCFEILTGTVPFSAITAEDTYRLILKATPAFPKDISEDAVDLVSALLSREPEDRMSLDTAAAHRWLRPRRLTRIAEQ